MKTSLIIAVVFSLAVQGFAEWTPPPNPKPYDILQEARQDAKEMRYEDALAKHVWFHEDALNHPSVAHDRMSWSLPDWQKLGEAYPPAFAKLRKIRDEVARKTSEASRREAFTLFNDAASINRTLGEEERTLDLFNAIDKRDSNTAKLVYIVAEPALVRSKEYALCGKYLETSTTVPRIVKSYRSMHEFESRHFPPNSRLAEMKFMNASTTHVALLVVNNRKDEAEQAAAIFRAELDDEKFQKEMDQALNGIVPKPWP